MDTYLAAGGQRDRLLQVVAPGAFELPALAAAAARSGRCSGVVAIGCLIQGETPHAGHIASAVAHGLVEVTLRTEIPVTFGLLTCDTVEQARARCGGDKGNKGTEAMQALLDTLAAADAIKDGQAPGNRNPTKPDKAATVHS